MPNYDRVQCDLVIKCEKPHEFGLRDRNTSGNICCWMLRDFLRKEFPYVNFDDGTVCKAEYKGEWHESGKYSPQSDIIAYHGDPWERIYEYVVVPLKSVFLVVEVKKWMNAIDVDHNPQTRGHDTYNKQIKARKKFLGKGLPVFLVAYRTSSDINKLRQNSDADKTYILSKGTIGTGVGKYYPDYVENFCKNYINCGELKQLVDDVRSIVS